MTNSKNGASLPSGNATGNIILQCLDDGQPMLGDSGQKTGSPNEQSCIDLNKEQIGVGSNIGQNTGLNCGRPGFDSSNEQQGIGSNIELLGIGSDNDNGNGATASFPQHANARDPNIWATNGRDVGSKFQGKQSFASLFKNNRAASDESKLHFISPSPLGELEFVSEDIDSVEKSFGFCLVGYVMGSRPSAYNIKNFIKGWGGSVKFTFKQNGWIRFQFPSEASRDAVLHGGPYMIFGMQLFLKKLPSCFLFSKEDMEFIPSWVQVYGLPIDCWTTNALSKVASVIGRPIHTDMMTITKKGANFARILVEVDVKKPRILDYVVKFPSGKKTTIGFTYEIETKFCEKCKSLGHTLERCGIEYEKRQNRPSSRQRDGKQVHTDVLEKEHSTNPIDSISEQLIGGGSSGHLGHTAESNGTKSGEDKGVDSEHSPQIISPMENACLPTPEETIPDVGLEDVGVGNVDNNSIADSDMHSSFMEECDVDSDELLDFLSTVAKQDKEEWQTVKGRNKRGQKKKISKEKWAENSGYNDVMGNFFEGMENTSPWDKKYDPKKNELSKGKQVRGSGKKKIDKVRPAISASGCP